MDGQDSQEILSSPEKLPDGWKVVEITDVDYANSSAMEDHDIPLDSEEGFESEDTGFIVVPTTVEGGLSVLYGGYARAELRENSKTIAVYRDGLLILEDTEEGAIGKHKSFIEAWNASKVEVSTEE